MVRTFTTTTHPECVLTEDVVFFPASGHRLPSYHVEGHAIADIKVNPSAPPATQPLAQRSEPPPYSQYPSNNGRQAGQNTGPPVHHTQQQSLQFANQPARQPTQPPPFVDPAILSMGKRSSVAPTAPVLSQPVTAAPQEAPATPIKPMTAARAATLPSNTSALASHTKQRNIRKPSAATLEGPFSSLDIADAEEADSETKTVQPSVRRASINKTRTGKPMEDPSPQKFDENGKKTRRGGKSRKKELAAQERKNGADNLEAARKGYAPYFFSTYISIMNPQCNVDEANHD